MQLFDEAQTVTREDRVIVTGNLLAGFGKFANGRIINYTSNAGIRGTPAQVAYNSSKAGVISLTKSLAVEWATVPQDVHPAWWTSRLVAVRGFAKYSRITRSIDQAVQGADLIMIAAPAIAHRVYATRPSPRIAGCT